MTNTHPSARRSLLRSRWASIGAAVAVTLGAGGLAVVGASGEPSSLVPVTPTRVLDTRADLGLTGPFTSPTSRTLQVTGSIPTDGPTTTVVPAGATAVAINITSVAPSNDGFVSVRPGDATGPPKTSNLNIAAGQVLANSVTVELPADGTLDIVFDAYGLAGATSDILVDVTGYFIAGAAGPEGPEGPEGPQGLQGPQGPEGTSPVVVFSASLDFGEEYTIVEADGSRIFARCFQEGGDDRLHIIATSTTDGWFTNQSSTTENGPGDEVNLETVSTSTGNTRYFDEIDEGHMMAPNGWYLAYQQETTALGLNVFGADCVTAGLAFTTDVDFG